MTTTTTTQPEQPLRFSHPTVTPTTAASFPWEHGIPTTPFWSTLDWVSTTHFLSNFAPTELSTIPIDETSTAPASDKLPLLIALLTTKLATLESEEAAPASLADTQPKVYRNLVHALYVLQTKAGLTRDAGKSIRALVATFPENQVLRCSLGNQLVAEGRYEEAEGLLRGYVAWIDHDGTLGRASPQGIGGRRALLSALWKQGDARRAEAKAVLEDIRGAIGGMVGTRFEVYVEAEEEELGRLVGELGA